MLKGLLKVIDSGQMGRLHAGVLQVLDTTGLQIRGRFLLEALADAGCRVDFERHRAWIKPEVVEAQIRTQRDRYGMVRSSLWYPFCRGLPADDVAWPDEFTVDFGFATPTIHEADTRTFRTPTADDQAQMIRLGNAVEEARAVCAPLICGEFDPRVEIIESARLLLLNTKKPGWVGTSSGKEVKYLAEFAALAADNSDEVRRTRPPIVVNAYCTTSPLKLDTRSCEVLEEALKYRFPICFATMPILGGTTPITPAGSAVVAAAELLGCMTAASLVDPEPYHYFTSICGEMDMKTTQICYCTPAAILTDAALHQLFRYQYGLVLNVEAGYLEAKEPGIQAAFMKTYRQMAFASTVSASLPIGLLDNGSVFSPAQAMIDLDVSRAIYGFGKGVEINDETLCVDLINEMAFCEQKTYLESEHTLAHFRDVIWDAAMFDRTYRRSGAVPRESPDEAILRRADAAWREMVASVEPIERDRAFVREVDRIAEAARKELLAD